MKKQWEYYDYCHVRYVPVASTRGKFSSDVFLRNSLLHSPYQKSFFLLVKGIKDVIGPWNTVWGVKLDRGVVSWELYFYNHQVKNSRMSVTNLLKVLRFHFKIPEPVQIDIERQPYIMFSLDLNDDVFSSKKIDGIHIYTPGRQGVSSGYSYYWGCNGYVLENHYDFFMMPREADKFVYRTKQSIVLATNCISFLKHDLVKRLMSCQKICIANKKDREAVYFSRVDIDQLLYFLGWFSYPEHITDFIKSQKGKLNHLLYDVAFDCAFGHKGIVFGKSSYYGVF